MISTRRNFNTYKTISRDRNLNTLQTSNQSRVPRYTANANVGNKNQEGSIIFNRTSKIFYGHNGTEWVPLSTASGGYDNGLQATDGSGNIITDNTAAGIITGIDAVAGGSESNASGDNTVAIGAKSEATEQFAIAIGNSQASGDSSISIGHGAISPNRDGVVIGTNASSNGINSVSIGNTAIANQGGVALGNLATATFINAIAIGNASVAQNGGSISVGNNAIASGNSVAIGSAANASGNGIALGSSNALGGELGLPTNFLTTGSTVSNLAGAIQVRINNNIYWVPLYNTLV